MDKKQFVSRLKQVKEQHNLKQREMYEAMGCSQAAYSSYENPNNNKFPSLEHLYNLSQKFNISIDWLLGIETGSKEQNSYYTLADIIHGLFWMDKFRNIKIDSYNQRVPLNYDEDYEMDIYYLSFFKDNEIDNELNDFLKEWKEAKEFCQGKSVGNTMLSLWKKDTIEKAKDKRFVFTEANKNPKLVPIPYGVEDEGLPFN